MPFIQRGTTHGIPYIDIRLAEDVVVFRGSVDESNGALLKGHVAMCVHDPVALKSIQLVLQGVKRLNWTERLTIPPTGLLPSNTRTIKHEEIFYEKKWNFLETGGASGMFTIKPNNYEYPFEQVLEGKLPESVEGIDAAHVVYRLKARVVRGKFSHDIVAKKHLRIIRTLSPEALELSQSMSVENLWPDKVEYSISIPSKAVVFGTSIPIDITLVPLLKGLTIGHVICAVKEIHTLSCPQKMSTKTETRHVLTQSFKTGVVEEGVEGEDLGRWIMHEIVRLPKSLNTCVQDCEFPSIKIRHKLKFTIQLHNPDGHMSELRASLPFMLFISPNYLMDDNNRIPPENEQHVVPVDLVNAPPRYDEHYLDRLYENVSRENYDTPLPSGSNTPMLLSRNNSVDGLSTLASNLTALDMADSMGLTEATNRTWQQASVGSTPAATPSGSAPPSTHGVHLPSHTATSEDGYSRTSTPPSPPLKNLSRVPSYSTAVRTGTRNLEDANTLPLYDEGEMYIRSAPVSPQNSPPTSGGFMGRGRNNTASSINAFGRHSGTHGFRRGGAEGDGSIASNLNLGQPSNTGGLSIGQRSHSSHHLPSLSDLLGGLRG